MEGCETFNVKILEEVLFMQLNTVWGKRQTDKMNVVLNLS